MKPPADPLTPRHARVRGAAISDEVSAGDGSWGPAMETRRGITVLLLVALAAGVLLVLAPRLEPTATLKPSISTPSTLAVAPPVNGSVAPSLDVTSIPASPAPTLSVTPEPPCLAADLQAHGGRQGESGTANGEVVLMNVGSPCSLEGDPLAITLVSAMGVTLATTLRPGDGTPGPSAFTLASMGTASLGLDCSNWCGPNPNPLRIRITLPNGGGVLEAGFDGPPDYDLIPRCDLPHGSSVIELLWGFTLVPNPNLPSYTYVGYAVTGSGRYSLEINGMAWTIDSGERARWVAVDGDAPAVVQVRSLPGCALVLRSTIHPGSAWHVEVTPRSTRVVDVGQAGDLAGFAGPGRPPICPQLGPSASKGQP